MILPGSFDRNNLFQTFDSDNAYEIPTLEPTDAVPDYLIEYGKRVRRCAGVLPGACVHFFLDDFRFESLWNRPRQTLSYIKNVGFSLTPDFSVCVDYPLPVQIWNTYRNRWLGCWWQSNGIKVIPTIGWSDKRSFDFVFSGVLPGHVVAIGTVGVRKSAMPNFESGYRALVERLTPRLVLCCGKRMPKHLESLAEVRYYQPFWRDIRNIANQVTTS